MLAPQRGRRRRAFLSALKRLSVVNWVRIAWLVAVLWYELGAFYWSVAGCQWPNFDHLKLENSKSYEAGWVGTNTPTHVLLVADPQILDRRSYPGRSGWLMALSQSIVDLNLRKSWLVATRFDPDVVIFLGDMMDNGRLTSSDEEYATYVARFKSTFKLKNPDTKVYYIPGNHDVGLRSSDLFHPRRRQRYLANFGPFNERLSIANHSLALVDASGLVEEDYKRAAFGTDFEHWKGIPDGAVEFTKEFGREGSVDPVILFTHIPLHRPDTASCGPLRERGTIRRGIGFGYQLTLGKLTAEFLLRNTRPSLVFSADDHDYCDYTHKVSLDEGSDALSVREVTVKSFSMAMGIKRPGFQLLSLLPHESGFVPSQGRTFADAPCLLPDQLTIYIERYLPLFVFSLVALAVSSFRTVSTHQLHHRDLRLPLANAPHDPRRESAWGGAALSPEVLHSQPATPLTHTSNSLRLPTNASHRSASGAPPATPTFRAFSPAANQLDTPVLFNGMGLGITVGGGAGDDGLAGGRDGGPEEEREAYEMLREQSKFFGSSKPGWAQHRERRWMWSWDFVFRNRRRRVSVGVPPTVEAFIRRLCGFQTASSSRDPTLWGVFFRDLFAAAWPPLFVFALIVYFMFR